MFVGSTFLISLSFLYFYGLIVGLSLNIAIFIGIIGAEGGGPKCRKC